MASPACVAYNWNMATFKDQLKMRDELTVRVKIHGKGNGSVVDIPTIPPRQTCSWSGCENTVVVMVYDIPACRFHAGPIIQREMAKQDKEK